MNLTMEPLISCTPSAVAQSLLRRTLADTAAERAEREKRIARYAELCRRGLALELSPQLLKDLA